MLAAKNRFGATRGKLALIVVLAVVQVVVIVRAVWNRSETVVEATPSRPTTRVATTTATAEAAPTNNEQDAANWPAATLDDAMAFDPFQKPQWLTATVVASAEAAEEPSKALEQLKQQGASIVVLSEDGKAATIGNQQFRIGDVIDGYQVTDITIRGVELTRIPTQ